MDIYHFAIPVIILVIIAVLILLRKSTKPTLPVQIEQNKDELNSSTTSKLSKTTLVAEQQSASVPEVKPKKVEQLQKEYEGAYFGTFKLKGNVQSVTAMDFKGSKVLLANTKNQMVMFNLKSWKKDVSHSTPEKFFVSLDNNGASAVCIGENYYYAALTFDKTIVCFEFKGEGGVYFKEVFRFPRNIFKANPGSMQVSKNQKYIVTTGSGSEAQIDVWSMKGEKLANENTYLIYNYGTSFGHRDILIRGWTSEIKIFETVEEKDGSFKKLQKKQHLAYEQSPLSASIDNKDMYSVSIGKNNKPKIWNLFDTGFNRTTEINESNADILALKPNKCSIYTFEHAVGHFKTLVVLANDFKFIVTDIHFKIMSAVEGLEIKELYINGTSKSIVLGTVSPQSQLTLWNLSKDLEKVSEIRT